METHMSYQYSDVMEEKATRSHTHMKDDSLQILEGILKDKGHKMFNKVVEMDVPILHGSDHMLEKIARKLNKGDDVVLVTGERGDILQEDKLERFRLKTVNAIGSGVVKEEEDQ